MLRCAAWRVAPQPQPKLTLVLLQLLLLLLVSEVPLEALVRPSMGAIQVWLARR